MPPADPSRRTFAVVVATRAATSTSVIRTLLALAAVLAVLVPGAPARAHNALIEASPAKNAKLTKAPKGVTLTFLQKLNPEYTVITVSDEREQAVATSEPDIDGATGAVTFGEPLANGVYTVAYQVVSTDGHPVKGSYRFTLDDPAAAASRPAAAASGGPAAVTPGGPAADAGSPAGAPGAGEANTSERAASSESPALGWIAGVAILVFAGLAGFVIVRRRRKA